MLLGHGVDVVHLHRVKALMQRRGALRFARRILSDREMQDWHTVDLQNVQAQARFLAVRWSLKESIYKALYSHCQPTWKDFTYLGVDHNAKRGPVVVCTSEHISQYVGRILSSVSHDGDYVFTSVIVEAKPP